eukprot:jgi/Galph1/4803/GphlegSOOS_G3467.1
MEEQVLEQWKLLEKNTMELATTTCKVKELLNHICDKIMATESKMEQLTTPLQSSIRETLTENPSTGAICLQ